MDKAQFTNLISELFLYFNRNLPKDVQVNMWYEDVKYIPGGEPLIWIKTQFKEAKSLPFNIPLEIKNYWKLYQKANRESMVPEQYDYCDDCFGHGYHMFEKLETMYYPPRWISYVAACSKCNNHKKQFGSVIMNGERLRIEGKPVGGRVPKIWSTTKQEIIDRGYEYLLQSNPRSKTGNVSVDDIKKLANDLFENIKTKELGEREKLKEAERQKNELEKQFPTPG